MKRQIRYRLFIIAATVIFSVVVFIPSTPLFKHMPQWWQEFMPSKGVNLGLDLLGGMHVVLVVESEKAVEGLVDRAMSTLPSALAGEEIEGVTVKRVSPLELELLFTGRDTTEATADFKDAILELVEQNYPSLNNTVRDIPGEEGASGRLVYHVRKSDEARIKDTAVSQALETIRNRVDQFGVSEPLIQRQANDQILIQLPGIKDAARALDLIGKTAQLAFKMINEDSPAWNKLPAWVPLGQEQAVLDDVAELLTDEDELLYERIIDEASGDVRKRPYIVKKTGAPERRRPHRRACEHRGVQRKGCVHYV